MMYSEAPNQAGSRLLPRQVPESTSSSRLESGETDSPSTEKDTSRYPLRRFYARTIVLIVFPILIAVYFVTVWRLLLQRGDDPVRYGIAGEVWIFYSWFIIGVFGLGLSKYGLSGVEMALLQSRHFRTPTAMVLIKHSGSSWSGPHGWVEWFTQVIRRRDARGYPVLWYIMAVLSLLPFIAFPLSGLCMELSDGYIANSQHPTVIGRTWSNFNRRQADQTTDRGLSRWETGASAEMPGIGILYTQPGVRRSQFDNLGALPNAFPTGDEDFEMFVAPQAATPSNGLAWGALLGYRCAVVEDESQFTILSQKSQAVVGSRTGTSDNSPIGLLTPSNTTIYVYNSDSINSYASNLFAYVELGVTQAFYPVYNGSEPGMSSSGDLLQEDILEMAIWQIQEKGSYTPDYYPDFVFNSTVTKPVRGLGQPLIQQPNGTFTRNHTFFQVKNTTDTTLEYYIDPRYLQIISLALPIGLRCSRGSALGTANLHARTSTFHSFKQTTSPPFNHSVEESQTNIFGSSAVQILLGQFFNLFTAISSPTPMTVSNSVMYQGFLQGQELQQSVMLAHAMDALQLMYDGVSSFDGGFVDRNLSSSQPGTIVTVGAVPPVLVAVLFLVWALGCVGLGLRYGFLPRWSAALDGYSLFRFGVNLARAIGDDGDLPLKRNLMDNAALREVPAALRRRV